MEELMYYVWQQRMPGVLALPEMEAGIEILDPGIRNLDAGPDFFNAKVRCGSTIWAGNVEMHVRASDWFRHHHDDDPAYGNVILHVVLEPDVAVVLQDVRKLLQVKMTFPQGFIDKYRMLTSAGAECFSVVTCSDRLEQLPKLVVSDWMTSLASERMSQKVQRVRDLIEIRQDSWKEAFYVILTRALGTGINGDACERLARSLPYAYILKHIDNPLQVEALLLGQGGFLEQSRSDSEVYYNDLRREYLFLRAKFSLHPLPVGCWKMARLRPPAFPQVRLALLAALLTSRRDFFSAILETDSLAGLVELFSVKLSGYWAVHYTFSTILPVGTGAGSADEASSDFTSAASNTDTATRRLGISTIHSLIINAVVPMLFAYAQWRSDEQLAQRAQLLLESLPAEVNRYVTACVAAGLPARNAFDTQALLQLYKNYCELRKCIRCRFGVWLMGH